MEILVTSIIAMLFGVVLGSAVVSFKTRDREEDIRLLFDFIKEAGADALEKRFPEKLEGILGSGINELLDSISYQYKTAERRGLEWEKAVDAIEDVVCVLDSQGRIVRANRATAARVGVDIRQVRGMKLEELLYTDPEVAEKDGPISATRRTERPASGMIDSCPIGKNLSLVTAPVRRDYGESMTCLVIRDCGETSTAESRSRRLGHMVASMSMPVVLADAVSGKVSYANDAFRQDFGYDDIDVRALNIDELPAMTDEKSRLQFRTLAHDDGKAIESFDVRVKTGEPMRAGVAANVFVGSSGKPEALLYLFTSLGPSPVPPKAKSAKPALDAEGSVVDDRPPQPAHDRASTEVEAV